MKTLKNWLATILIMSVISIAVPIYIPVEAINITTTIIIN